MAFSSITDRTSYTNYETILNTTRSLLPENLYCIRRARNILGKKRLMKGRTILKLKKRVMYPVHTTNCHKVCSKHVITTPVPISITPLTTCYPYQQDYSYAVAVHDWHPMNTPLFTVQSVPVIVQRASPIFATQICPFVAAVVPPVISPILAPIFVQDSGTNVSNYINKYSLPTEPIDSVTGIANEKTYYMEDEVHDRQMECENELIYNVDRINIGNEGNQADPLDVYLTLPKELFPTARMLTLDPNPIIDEFCKIPNLQIHAPWLLDLEFGIPRTPTTRPMPTYDVKFNSIHCKNAPNAIHPSFESCDPDFKNILLFYYDCVVSAWYRGYMIMNCDRSVENFQSWLLLPMQVLGMCWP